MDYFSYPIIDVEATSLRLKELREKRNITISTLQSLFSFSHPQAIYAWENPKSKTLPRLDNLVTLAKLYDVSLDDLIIVGNRHNNFISVCEKRIPFGVPEETLTFIRQNSSHQALIALGSFFNYDLC